jgi:hypothetical protein
VQRVGTLTVDRIDYNPETGRHASQEILMGRYGPALVQFVGAHLDEIAPPAGGGGARRVQEALQARLRQDAAGYAGWADFQAADLEALATLIVDHLVRNPGGGNLVSAPLRPGVINALRHGLPSAASDDRNAAEEMRSALTENEITEFNAVLNAASTKSSAKGAPNVVAQGDLDGAVGGLGAATQAVRDLIVRQTASLLRRMEGEIDLIDTGNLGAAAGLGMGVRSMHQNGAGWLPDGAVALPTTLAALTNQINATFATYFTPGRRAYLARISGAERLAIRQSMMSRAVRAEIGPLPERTKIMLIWGSYAQNQGALMNYVEFNVASRINRMMYDYVNGRFYITPHYNWYRGFNPFFQLTGLRDT